MKKLIFTLAIMFSVLASANAQRNWIGGAVGFSQEKNTNAANVEVKTTSFSILPEYGYFFSDNLGVAVRAGYRHDKTGDLKTDNFVINPFVRYTFLKGSIGGLFVDGGVSASFGKTGAGDRVSTWGIDIGITPGAIINIGNGFSLYATFGRFGYSHDEQKTEPEKTKNDNFSFGLNLNELTTGIIYSF